MPGAPSPPNAAHRGPPWLAGLPQWTFVVGLFFALLWLPAALLDLLIPGWYLPSQTWLRLSTPAAYVLLAVSTVVTFLFATRISKHNDANAYVDGIFVAGLTAVVFHAPVVDLVHKNVPALLAAAFGSEIAHTYTVIRADRPTEKWCHTPVDLSDMPPGIKLCGMGNIFRAQLVPGQTVTFGGGGTWMGLYVQRIQP